MIVRGLICILALSLSLKVSAGLNDEFIFSSKFGLLTESVTSNWRTDDVAGISYGGELSGIPRDSGQVLYYYNGKLSLVLMGYGLYPQTFETERAYKRWTVQAVNLLREKAEQKYGIPSRDDLICPITEPFAHCEGSVVWRGDKKVFDIQVSPRNLSKYDQAYYGIAEAFQFRYLYVAVEDYDLMMARLPSLNQTREERQTRNMRRNLSTILRYELRNSGLDLDDYLDNLANPFAKIQELQREGSNEFVGGVRANYTPDRWVRSFRLQ